MGGGYGAGDCGDTHLNADDDYPEFVVPLAGAVSGGEGIRGIAICGSGVGACIAANKVRGVRACLIHEAYSARQGVEDDDMNVLCLGGKAIGSAIALEWIRTFLTAHFSNAPHHRRHSDKSAGPRDWQNWAVIPANSASSGDR